MCGSAEARLRHRRSLSHGGAGLNQAADWAEERFRQYGFNVQRDQFREDMTAQVRVVHAATPNTCAVKHATVITERDSKCF